MPDSLLVALVESRPYSAEALHELAQPLLREYAGDTLVTERLLQNRANEVGPVLCRDPDRLPTGFVVLPTEPRQALIGLCSESLPGECDQQEHLHNTNNAFVRLL